jgi:hypothetical protein
MVMLHWVSLEHRVISDDPVPSTKSRGHRALLVSLMPYLLAFNNSG